MAAPTPNEQILETEEQIRIKKRASGPMAAAMHIFTSTDYKPVIDNHNTLMKQIETDPYNKYITIRARLRNSGPTASMPEFEGVIAALTVALFQDPENISIIENDLTLKQTRELLVHSLMAIQIPNRYWYPYKATILVIEQMLNLCDILVRKKNTTLVNYYHNLRYRLYLTQILDDAFPDAIVIPTIKNIGTTFLIKTRPVPIMFLGVAPNGSFADQYLNSPIDFWAHDVQHARRLLQENQRYYDIVVKHINYYTKRSPFDVITMDQFYEHSVKYSESLYPLWVQTAGDDEATAEYKKLKKLLIFEVTHEKAWPLTKFSLCRNIPLGYDIFPIELIVSDGKTLMTVDEAYNDPTTLSNLYHKLRKGFYNNVENPDARIVSPKYRTARHIATAALQLLTEIGCKKSYTLEQLLALTQDPVGAEEFTEKNKSISMEDNANLSVLERYPTQRMPYWQVEEEAPLISKIENNAITYFGGKKRGKTHSRKLKTRKITKHKHKKH